MRINLWHTAIFFVFLIIFYNPSGKDAIAQVYIGEHRATVSSSPKKIFVLFKTTPNSSALLSVKSAMEGSQLVNGLANSKVAVYEVEGSIKQALESVRTNPNVETAFAVPKVFTAKTANDPAFAEQWAIGDIKVGADGQSAWDLISDIGAKTSAVKIAIVDSGVDRNHTDLTGKISSEDYVYCSANGCQTGADAKDGVGHGTHVAGLAGALTDNSAGIASVGWGVKLMSVKILGDDGSGDLDVALKGIEWAADHGARIINMSFGAIEQNLTPDAKMLIQQTVNRVWNKNVVLVAAAGNCGAANTNGNPECAIYDDDGNVTGYASNPNFYPAALDHVLSVGASTKTHTLAIYSEYGNWVDVAAPGGQCNSSSNRQSCILSTYPSALITQPPNPTPQSVPYAYMSGTSMATPHVSAIAALLLAAKPQLTNAQVVDIIKSTADESILGSSITSNGLVNGLEALKQVVDTVNVTPTITPTGNPEITPTPTVSPVPSISPSLLKTPPYPFPFPPYCPKIDNCDLKKWGDANCDGSIGLDDLKIWFGQYDQMVPSENDENANYDCTEGIKNSYFVDLIDFEIWRGSMYEKNYPTIVPSPSPTSASALSPTPTSSGNPSPTPSNRNVIRGNIWHDGNRNGVKDSSEKYIGDLELKLMRVRANGNENQVAVTKSRKDPEDARNYRFGNVSSGNYRINIGNLGSFHVVACGNITTPSQIPANRYFYCRKGGVRTLMQWNTASSPFKEVSNNYIIYQSGQVNIDIPLGPDAN